MYHLLVAHGENRWRRSVRSYFGIVFGANMLIYPILCTVAMENKEWERFGLQAQVPFYHTHDVMTVTGNEHTPCETTFRSHPGINGNDISSSDDRYLLWSASLPPAARVGGHVQRPPCSEAQARAANSEIDA